MKGIVDEVKLDELGKMVIVEVKTRRSNSLPSDAQKKTAELQVPDAESTCYNGATRLMGRLRCARTMRADLTFPDFNGCVVSILS